MCKVERRVGKSVKHPGDGLGLGVEGMRGAPNLSCRCRYSVLAPGEASTEA
jgi:hypothetical protein